jgi:hypothetical protein
VRAVGDTASTAALEQEWQQVVEQQVEAEHHPRTDLDHVHHQREQEHVHAHHVAREPQEVEAEHSRDRARSADHRHLRAGGEELEGERRGDPGPQVSQQVAQAAEPVLHVVAVDPQEQHVPEQVQEAAVEEHRHQQVGETRVRRAIAVLEHEEVVAAGLLGQHPDRDLRRQARRHHPKVLAERRVARIRRRER